MTEKQKALELVGKMCLNDCTDKNIKLSKQFALIAVDEIIGSHLLSDKIFDTHPVDYWNKVKEEINKI